MIKRPRDRAQLAKLIVDIASGEVDDNVPPAKKRIKAKKSQKKSKKSK